MNKSINKGTASMFHASGKPYTSISNEAVDALTNPDALAIWTYLQTRDSGWTVIGGYLQDRFGMGRERYAKAMRCLKDVGLIRHEFVQCPETNAMTGRRVIVNHSPNLQVPEPTESRTFGKTTTTNKGFTTNKESIPMVEKSTLVDEAFNLFWSAGMRKANKKGALSSFAKAVKESKMDAEQFAQKLVKDVKARIASGQIGFKEMHPTTYLNGQRWEDEIVRPEEQKQPQLGQQQERGWV